MRANPHGADAIGPLARAGECGSFATVARQIPDEHQINAAPDAGGSCAFQIGGYYSRYPSRPDAASIAGPAMRQA